LQSRFINRDSFLNTLIMKNAVIISMSCIAILIASCSPGGEKKVVIMASGKFTVEGKTIKIEPSLTHTEQEVVFKEDKVTLTIQSTDGNNKTFDLPTNGVYLLNLQTDTLIGGNVNYGTQGMPAFISIEQLDHIIDSTKQLMAGLNASDAKKTYFLPPLTIKKVSDLPGARVIGPYKGIPYKIEADNNGKMPDIIKFFSNKQKRETLKDLEDERTKIKSK
jgi:hypothetical protein